MQKYLPCPQRNSQNFRVRMQKRKKKGKKFNCLESTKLSEKVLHRHTVKKKWYKSEAAQTKMADAQWSTKKERKKSLLVHRFAGLRKGEQPRVSCVVAKRGKWGESLASFASSEENKYKENKKEIKSC